MTFTEAEQATLDQIDSTGLHLNEGRPCECGEDADYTTRKKRAFSDSMVYKHSAKCCDNQFSTWTEG